MPRIRSIKPEHWDDKLLPFISLGAHLLWIGMWNYADDKGIIENDPHLLKSNVFPRRKSVKPSQIKKWVEELVKYRFVIPFKYKDTQYVIHRTFDIHQKIDKPQPSKIDSETIRRIFVEYSKNGSVTLDERSVTGEDKERRGEDKDNFFKEGNEDFLNGNFLIPKMITIFKEYFPDYPLSLYSDSESCADISKKIASSKKWKQEEVYNGKMNDALEEWKSIVEFAKSDKWYCKRSISDFNKEWQRLIQAKNAGSDKPIAQPKIKM